MPMERVHLAVALTPLAIYLLRLGLLNLLHWPVVKSGAQNIAFLGFGLSGFVIVGPMGLFLPNAAANQFGPWVWLLMIVFYGLCITLWILLARPRLIIYNASVELVRPVLANIATKLDGEVRWAGDSVVMPHANVQLHLEAYAPMRNVSLVAIGEQQSYSGWQRLGRELRAGLRATEVPRNPRGFSFLAVGIVMASWPFYLMIREGDAVAQTLREMLRM
jgi:hypothetical protein